VCLTQRKARTVTSSALDASAFAARVGGRGPFPLKRKSIIWAVFGALTVAVVAVLLRSGPSNPGNRSILNRYVQLTLRSNREVAGLEYAYFSLSNRTENSVSYVGDRNMELFCSVIERRFDSNIGRPTVTNHSWVRIQESQPLYPLSLPAHSSVDFMVYYPARVTGAVLAVNYLPAKSRLARTAENLKLRVMGKQAKATNEYDSIKLKLPLPR